MTEEDFLAWKEHPVTAWVMNALRAIADENEALAKHETWQIACGEAANTIDTHRLTVQAEKAKAYRALANATFDDFDEGNDE